MSKNTFIKATKTKPEIDDNPPNPSELGCFFLALIGLLAAAAYFLSQIN